MNVQSPMEEKYGGFSNDVRPVRAEREEFDTRINEAFIRKMKMLEASGLAVSKKILKVDDGNKPGQSALSPAEQAKKIRNKELMMSNLMLYATGAHANLKLVCNRDYSTQEEAQFLIDQINAYNVDMMHYFSRAKRPQKS